MAANPIDQAMAGGGPAGPTIGAASNPIDRIMAQHGQGPGVNPIDAAMNPQLAAAAHPNKSLVGQLGDIIQSAPSGLFHFVTDALTDPGAGAMLGATIGSIVPGPGTAIGAAIGGAIGGVGYGVRGAVTQHWDLPATQRFLSSIGSTAQDVANPSRFAQASANGTIVSKIIGDVGNVALAAGGASKALDAAAGGTLSDAVAAQNAADAAAKAADQANTALQQAEERFGPAATANDPIATQQLEDARMAAFKTAAAADEWSLRAQNAVSSAGTALKAYRMADSIARLGNAGAFAPAKVWTKPAGFVARYTGKLLGPTISKALDKYAPGLKDTLANAAQHVSDWNAANKMIEYHMDKTTGLEAGVRRAVLDIGQTLGRDAPPAAGEAAILDLLRVPEAIEPARAALSAAGHADIGEQLVDHVISDPELGISREAYDLAAQLRDGTLERTNPELYARLRQAQEIYRNTMGANSPMTERYLSNVGGMRPISERAMAERQWEVTGTTPRPSALEEVGRRGEQMYERATQAVEERGAKLAKVQAKEKVAPEAQAKPGDALAADYMEAHRLAEMVVDRVRGTPLTPGAPKEILDHLLGRDTAGIPRHVLIEELRERLFANREGRSGNPAMDTLARQGNWQGLGIRPGQRGLEAVRSAASRRGQIEALQEMQQRAGARAEASELNATYARFRPPSEEAVRLHGPEEAYQAELSREGMGYESRREPGVSPRRLGRMEGEEAGAGHVLDTAFRVERRVGRDVTERTATAGARGARQQGAVFKQGTQEGARMERTAKAARDLGIAQRHLDRIPEILQRRLQYVSDKLTNAPARYRDVIVTARKANAELSRMADEADQLAPGAGDTIRAAMAEIPDTLTKAVDRGVNPEYVIGRRPGREPPTGEGWARQAYQLPRRGRTGEETVKRTAAIPKSFAEVGRLNVARIRQQVENEAATAMERAFGTSVRVELSQQKEDGTLGELPRMTAGEMDRAMSDRGFVAWDPKNPFGKVPSHEVTADTRYIPEAIYKGFQRHFGQGGKAEQFFQNYYDRPMRAWKASVLALTTRWHISHIIGHALSGTLGAGIDPGRYVARIFEARRLLRDNPELVPPELLSRGLTAAESQAQQIEENPPRTVVGRVAMRSYNRVAWMDDMQRVAIWLERRNTLSDKELIDFRRQHPELSHLTPGQIRDQAAIRLSLRAAGDFTHLHPFERQVMRRVFPFYTWLRHITQLAFHLTASDPLRVVWMLHLADLYGDKQPFPFMQGTVSLGGGHYLRLPKINPFQELALSPGDLLKNLTPFLTVPAQLAGRDLKTGNLLGRAPGTYRLDAYGKPEATGQDLGGAAYLLANQVPQLRLARELYESATGGVRERYPSGQEVRVHGQTQYSHPGFLAGAGSSLGSFAGIPQVEKVNVAREAQIVNRRIQLNAKSARRYNASGGSTFKLPKAGAQVAGNPIDAALARGR